MTILNNILLRNIWKNQDAEKKKICLIGTLHLIMVLYGIIITIWNVMLLQHAMYPYEVFYVLGFYFGHLFLIFLLCCGTLQGLYQIQLPWLIVTFAVFLSITFLSLEQVWNLKSLYIQGYIIMNFLYVGICWYMWLTVFKNFRRNFSTYKQKRNMKIVLING